MKRLIPALVLGFLFLVPLTASSRMVRALNVNTGEIEIFYVQDPEVRQPNPYTVEGMEKAKRDLNKGVREMQDSTDKYLGKSPRNRQDEEDEDD